jgi:Double zinc ribbon
MTIAFTGPELTLLVVVVILVIIVIGVFLYLASRLRNRRDRLLTDLKGKPELVQDRAFNRLAMARREAEIVARTGTDLGDARSLIARSQAAFDLRQFARSYELAQSAHEALVNARSKAALPSLTPEPTPSHPAAGPGLPLRDAAAGPEPAPAASLPKNRAESHFLLVLLTQELAAAPPNAGSTLEARSMATQAQAAFDRAEYNDAFRLALKGRRALGGPLETVAPSPTSSGAALSGSGARDLTGVADAVAGTARCPSCGHPTPPGDVFCRGCGRSLVPSTCAACGAPRAPRDVFCGRCGTSYSA